MRRNGKPQSCEPCRKSKLKCDHTRPVCGRCATRNMTQSCFYHPSPMTKKPVPDPTRGNSLYNYRVGKLTSPKYASP